MAIEKGRAGYMAEQAKVNRISHDYDTYSKPILNLRNVKSDGDLVDPKLVREHTLFVLELHGISVKIAATKDNQINADEPFVI